MNEKNSLWKTNLIWNLCSATHYLAVGLVQSTSKLSEQEATLTELIHTNQTIVDNTQQTDKKLLKTINNVVGLTREKPSLAVIVRLPLSGINRYLLLRMN